MVKIKICGIRRTEDIEIINKYRPDYIGFICSTGYFRYVPIETAFRLKKMLDPSVKVAGVFVNESIEYIEKYLVNNVIDVIQLHGTEDDEYIGKLRKIIKLLDINIPIMKAYKISGEKDIIMAKRSTADYLLLDSGAGTGKIFDWKLIKNIGRPFYLAGGINPDNVCDAVKNVNPYGIDVSSGVETNRVKDPEKIGQLIMKIKNMK
ncbi:MAG: phosphoribosylanthranilate isomerase [Lachnospiraceae bacterium]|nr:phosphoribosylanthranilate isomerase [Lachnospiraceae bacterium]